MSRSLYTTKDITDEKLLLMRKQNGIDPITGEVILNPACLDHDHVSQNIRGVLGRSSNSWEGIVTNAYNRHMAWSTDTTLPVLLRNLASYLEVDYSNNPYHNGWIKRVTIDYKKLTAVQQNTVLTNLGSKTGSNATERLKLFKVLTLDRSLGYDTIRTSINSVKDT